MKVFVSDLSRKLGALEFIWLLSAVSDCLKHQKEEYIFPHKNLFFSFASATHSFDIFQNDEQTFVFKLVLWFFWENTIFLTCIAKGQGNCFQSAQRDNCYLLNRDVFQELLTRSTWGYKISYVFVVNKINVYQLKFHLLMSTKTYQKIRAAVPLV